MIVSSKVLFFLFTICFLAGNSVADDELVSFSPDGKRMVFRDARDKNIPAVEPAETFPVKARCFRNKVWRGQFTKIAPNMPTGEIRGSIFYVIFTKWDNENIVLSVASRRGGTIICPIDKLDQVSCYWTEGKNRNNYKMEIDFGSQTFSLQASDGYGIRRFEAVATLPGAR